MVANVGCWAFMRRTCEKKVGKAEMIILRWMCCPTRKDSMHSDIIRGDIGVMSIEKKLTENQFRWYRQVQRRPLEAPLRRVDNMVFSHVKRGRGRQKNIIGKVLLKITLL